MTYTDRARKMRPYIEQAASALDDKTVSLAPELLGTLTGGNSLKTNIQLAYNNARAAAQIAVELAK